MSTITPIEDVEKKILTFFDESSPIPLAEYHAFMNEYSDLCFAILGKDPAVEEKKKAFLETKDNMPISIYQGKRECANAVRWGNGGPGDVIMSFQNEPVSLLVQHPELFFWHISMQHPAKDHTYVLSHTIQPLDLYNHDLLNEIINGRQRSELVSLLEFSDEPHRSHGLRLGIGRVEEQHFRCTPYSPTATIIFPDTSPLSKARISTIDDTIYSIDVKLYHLFDSR